jgi:hypothetical protein
VAVVNVEVTLGARLALAPARIWELSSYCQKTQDYQAQHRADHTRTILRAGQGCTDLFSNFAQGERTRALKKAWMLHCFPPGNWATL